MSTANAALARRVWLRFGLAPVLMGLVFFVPAGTLAWWHGWVYIAIICVPMLFVVLYLFKHDPELLEQRLSQREPEKTQRTIIVIGDLLGLAAYILPGLDHRLGWSEVPLWLVLPAQVMVLLAYGLIVLVLRENSYASRVVKVMPGQTVISTGPYAVVRHPMYVGSNLLVLFSPLALGSYWALPAFLAIVPLMIWRILDEERLLMKELPGYAEYREKTRYRLLPHVW